MNSEILLLLPICLIFGSVSAFGGGETLRSPARAGTFYAGEPGELRRDVEGYLERAEELDLDAEVLGLMVPHAGYVFSGQTAAWSYRQVRGERFDLVILLGNAHAAPVRGLALDGSGKWRTPLGDLEVDRPLAERLAAEDPLFKLDRGPHRRDHVLEVQLPFLQTVLEPGFRILPILLGPGEQARQAGERLATLLPPLLEGRRWLVVCSADLTHYPREADSRRIDEGLLEVLERYDPAALRGYIRSGMAAGTANLDCVTCSENAILAAMGLCRAGGATAIRRLHYTNSAGSRYGDAHRVVGYGAAAFLGSRPPRGSQAASPGKEEGTGIGEAARQALLRLARETLEARVNGKDAPSFESDQPVLQEMRGAFVTLKKGRELRGCIGYIRPVMRLWESVRDNAESAALKDPRFPPVRPEELPEIHIEISALSPLRKVAGPEEIVIGRHGIYITRGFHRAVFLPQVAPEQGWSLEKTLQALCRKAGLGRDAWREPGMEFEVFSAEVFQEPGGSP